MIGETPAVERSLIERPDDSLGDLSPLEQAKRARNSIFSNAALTAKITLKAVIVTIETTMLTQMLGQLSKADQQLLRNLIRQAIQ